MFPLNGAPRLTAKSSAKARFQAYLVQLLCKVRQESLCAGEAGAGPSSPMMCPRKKGAVSNSSAASLVACVMVQGGLKAATTVVGPFEKGTVDQCLARLKPHSIIVLFSEPLSSHDNIHP